MLENWLYSIFFMDNFNLVDYCVNCFININLTFWYSIDELNLMSYLIYTYNYFNINLIYENNLMYLLYSVMWNFDYLTEIVVDEIYEEEFFINLILDNSYITNIQSNINNYSWNKNYTYATATILEDYEFMFNDIINYDYINNNIFGKLNYSIYNNITFESVNLIIMYIFNIVYITAFIIIVYTIYLTYLNTNYKNDNLTDFENFNESMQTECEKELGSLDDILLGLLNISFLFGWFFYLNIVFINNTYNDMVCLFFTLPMLYYIIFSIPSYLLYDFGIIFTTYLRGASNTKFLIFELFYDYIAVFIYFLRLMVQSVRFLLMFITFCSLHDLVLFSNISNLSFLGYSSIWDNLTTINSSSSLFSYFFFNNILAYIVWWLYEIGHMFFIIIGQFIAFFAMVFWLFLFLYSFFFFLKLEDFFYYKRKNLILNNK